MGLKILTSASMDISFGRILTGGIRALGLHSSVRLV